MPRLFTSKTTRSWSVFLASSLLLTGAWAGKSPDSIEGAVKVTAEDFIERINKIPEFVIIDSRIPSDRKQGFIEDLLSLPDTDTTCESLSRVISKKNTASLFYCNGVKCERSANAIRIALDCGYSNIYWFRGGFEEWLEKGYPYLQE